MAEYTINTSSIRIPPQSLEAEMALLGSIMLRPEAMYEVLDAVSPAYFYADRHRLIFETMQELFSKSVPIDFLSLSSRLKEKQLLEQVGGNVFITELASLVPSSASVRHYADIVRKKHMMRKLIEASEDIARIGFDESADLEESLDAADKKIFEITNQGGSHKFVEMKDT
ncbi:MAG TPA: DnaB-like helicase N-terminal domain-containing protein, partial [Candidatus Paceibacterota bacterium]|nr:DnaB-like helicase N-terminal domain-containing protein [Candidatus Paceibacterota bacterium]